MDDVPEGIGPAPNRQVLVVVPVMDVGVMRMAVDQRAVPMLVRVRLVVRQAGSMVVLVMVVV
jgi:hypothetical protein